MRWWALGGAIGLAGAVALAVEYGWIRLHDPPLSVYPVQGLDVSHHQGAIDWPRVAEGGRFRFVWIKATEGGDHVDPRFRENWDGARAAGLVVGAYHFFTLCRPGAEQARNLLARLPEDDGPTLPVAVDLELGGNCAARPSRGGVRREIDALLEAIEQHTGRRAVLYTTFEFHRDYLRGSWPSGHPLWLRSVVSEPGDLDGQRWLFWQYLPRGRVPGVDGFVDQNAFAGDDAAFAAFVRTPGEEP